MLASVFADESYTGDDSVILIGALVAPLGDWYRFSLVWKELLEVAGIPYAHYFEMHRSKGHFKDWGVQKKAEWIRASYEVVNEICSFGFTVSLDRKLYKDVYRADFPARSSPDSAYGVCAREVFGQGIRLAREYLSQDVVLNFAFESGHLNAPNASQIYTDLKRHASGGDANFGAFALIDKKDAAGLQAADHVAVTARQALPKAVAENTFRHAPEGFDLAGLRVLDERAGKCLLFKFEIDEAQLLWHRDQKAEMDREKRLARNIAKKEGKRERS